MWDAGGGGPNRHPQPPLWMLRRGRQHLGLRGHRQEPPGREHPAPDLQRPVAQESGQIGDFRNPGRREQEQRQPRRHGSAVLLPDGQRARDDERGGGFDRAGPPLALGDREREIAADQAIVDHPEHAVQQSRVAFVKGGERPKQGVEHVDHRRDHRDAQQHHGRHVVPHAGDRSDVAAVGQAESHAEQQRSEFLEHRTVLSQRPAWLPSRDRARRASCTNGCSSGSQSRHRSTNAAYSTMASARRPS